MKAPQRFAAWMANHRHTDRRFGHVYLYHPRSDAHSVALCEFIIDDLVAAPPELRGQAARGEVAYGINLPFIAPNGKAKNLDLAIGRPTQPVAASSMNERGIARVDQLAELYFGCEAKSVMTEHKKSQPRVYDELSSSHEIVHRGRRDAIARGIAVVNIAETFVSPLRQHSREQPLAKSHHRQPDVAASMIQHLRGLRIRDEPDEVGFDVFATIVVVAVNQICSNLHVAPPAPQPGERDHYATFVDRFVRFYRDRFA